MRRRKIKYVNGWQLNGRAISFKMLKIILRNEQRESIKHQRRAFQLFAESMGW